jgi:signal transduction histidine kinase
MAPVPPTLDRSREQPDDETDGGVLSHQRLHDLTRANMQVNTEVIGGLTFPLISQRILRLAAGLVDAGYGTLAVYDADGTLEQLFHVGTGPATVAEIDDLSNKSDLLGAIQNSHPIRLRRFAGDERWSGFPTEHAPVDSLLGLAIRSRNKVLGNLYLAHRHGAEFSDEDEEVLTAFATTAGVAIEDARLFEQAQGGQRWQMASAEISGMLLARDSGSDPLQVIIEKVCQLCNADLGALVLSSADSEAFSVTVASGVAANKLRGMTYSAKNSMIRMAMDTGRAIRVATLDDQNGFEVYLSKVVEIGPVMAVPLWGHNKSQGALVVGRRAGRRAFTRADLELAVTFATHAAIARDLADARADQQRLALLKDRARIARDLHDHVIQRLFAAGLTMQSMAATAAIPEFADRLDSVIVNINDTIRQIRTSIFQLQASDSTTPAGVRSIVLEIIDQIIPALGFTPMTRFSGPLDTAVPSAAMDAIAAVVREAVTNVAKHARATTLEVELSLDNHQLSVDVSDNGIGLKTNDKPRRSGLDNLKRRADIWEGTFTLTANEPTGTRLNWTIPLR